MKPLTDKQKAEIQAVTDAYAASVKTHPTKGKYNFGGFYRRMDSIESNFSGVGNITRNDVRFSANPYVEDSGNPAADESGIYDDCSTFAEYSTKAREVSAFGRIKSLVANSNMRESLKTYILSRNSQIRAANKIAEAKKDRKKSQVSRPSWY